MLQLVLNVLKKTKNKLIYFFGVLMIIGVLHDFLVVGSVLVIKNQGISFGQQIPLVFIITLIFCIFSFVLFLREESFGLLMISVGAFINLIDRLRFGFVRDYWNLVGSGIYNNINDWIISLGVILFLVEIIWIKKLK